MSDFYLENSTEMNDSKLLNSTKIESINADEIQKIKDEVQKMMGKNYKTREPKLNQTLSTKMTKKGIFSANISMSTFCPRNYFEEPTPRVASGPLSRLSRNESPYYQRSVDGKPFTYFDKIKLRK